MLVRLLTTGLIAGATAGFLAALLQLYFLQPVLLHAELYEGGELVHFGADSVQTKPDLGGFDPLRNVTNLLIGMLTYAGYGLILAALMFAADARGANVNARSGLIWGVCGFVAVHFAPGFSLAPEVPGVAEIDLRARQVWWFAAVFAGGIALWLIAFGRNWLAWGSAIVLLLAPHVVGAPEADVLVGSAPTEIGAQFAARAFGVGLAAWVMLGFFAGALWDRFEPSEG